MENQKIKQTLDELAQYERSGSRDSRCKLFAKRAHDVIVEAYETKFDANWKKTGEYAKRDGRDTTDADKLIEMGANEAVFGKGRALLRK